MSTCKPFPEASCSVPKRSVSGSHEACFCLSPTTPLVVKEFPENGPAISCKHKVWTLVLSTQNLRARITKSMGSQDHFTRLPHELLTKIFRTAVWKKPIDIRTLSRLERVCGRFSRVAKEITVLSEHVVSQNTKEQFLQFMARNHRAWEGIKIRVKEGVDPMPIILAAIAPAVRSLRFVKIDSGFLDEGMTCDILTVLLEQWFVSSSPFRF
jgi:hypothetical protein